MGFGLALMILGVAGYFAAEPAHRSPTALIPSIAGVLLAICGVLARDPGKRMHAMHAAAAIGVLGFVAPLGRLIPQWVRGPPPVGLALFSQVAMSAICLLFVILC